MIRSCILPSGVIHVLTVEGHDVIEHTLGLDSRTVGVELYGLDITVDGLMPLAMLAGFIAKLVVFLSCHIEILIRPPLTPPT